MSTSEEGTFCRPPSAAGYPAGSEQLWSADIAGVTTVGGDIDLATRAAFALIVAGATRAARGTTAETHLDLGAVGFIDVGGIRVLVDAATERGPIADVVVHRPPAILGRLLALGWGPVPGLRFES
ncbi:MAG TPA: hypothetical protein VFP54_12460 [Acidimicrobiales bacterium]|nr:hypothetical protein [Acidimicrobiales bacterium]